MTAYKVTQLSREVLVKDSPPVRVAGLRRETLGSDDTQVRIANLARETLWGRAPPFRASLLVREALVSAGATPPAGSMSFIGLYPNVGAVAPASGSMTFIGGLPSVAPATVVQPAAGLMSFIGGVPEIFNNSTPPFDWEATVIWQYQASPIIKTIVANLAAYLDPRTNFDAFFNMIWNVETAQGIGLDIWGRIVGCQRIIEVPGAGDYTGFEEAGDYTARTPWNQAPWYSGATASNAYPLTDDAFRLLIYAKALANICDGSIPGLNAILLTLFPQRGACYVTDGGNMTMTYTFDFPLSAVENAIVSSAGILPTPVGVAATIIAP